MRKLFLYVPLACLLLFTGACASGDDTQEVVFMDNFKVFEEFEMKRDYDAMLEKELGGERSYLDSMARALESLKDQTELAKKKTELYEKQQLFEQKFGELSDKYTKEVYARLNKYIESYGKERGYKLIVGSTGDGNVMYVDTTVNVTQDLLKYVNKEYNK